MMTAKVYVYFDNGEVFRYTPTIKPTKKDTPETIWRKVEVQARKHIKTETDYDIDKIDKIYVSVRED